MIADAIVVGGGLAGLVAAAELIEAGRKIILLDQEPEQALGGQAFWSFGGLFFVNSPEQRRMRIRDSHDLALQDWLGAAGFDREEDLMPRKSAEACAGSRSSAGPSAAVTPPPSTATRCRASTSPGAPAPASSRRSSTAYA